MDGGEDGGIGEELGDALLWSCSVEALETSGELFGAVYWTDVALEVLYGGLSGLERRIGALG